MAATSGSGVRDFYIDTILYHGKDAKSVHGGKSNISPRILQEVTTKFPDASNSNFVNGNISAQEASVRNVQHQSQMQTLPAWVFCTRYSDRPCSGIYISMMKM